MHICKKRTDKRGTNTKPVRLLDTMKSITLDPYTFRFISRYVLPHSKTHNMLQMKHLCNILFTDDSSFNGTRNRSPLHLYLAVQCYHIALLCARGSRFPVRVDTRFSCHPLNATRSCVVASKPEKLGCWKQNRSISHLFAWHNTIY